MPFTFKIAKRLARGRRTLPRLAAALIFVAGCADSVGTEPTDQALPDTAIAYNATSITITPGSASGSVGQSAQFSAVIRDKNGIAITGHTVTWSVGNSAVVSVSASGYATAVGGGSSTVNASYNGIVGRAAVTVTGATITVSKVALTPKTSTLLIGAKQQFAAAVTDASGVSLPTVGIQWVSTNSSLVKIDSTGIATALAVGTVNIIARAGGKADTASVTVGTGTPVTQVASVTVTPGSASGNVGDAAQFTADVKDASGASLTGQTVTWSSSNTAVVTVNSSGYATAVGGGTANLVATAGGKSGLSAITVAGTTPPSQAAVATVSLSPGTFTLGLAGIQNVGVTLKDASGNILTGRTVTWASSSPLVASVSVLGVVTGLLQGSSTLTATSEGKSATASVTVTGGITPPPPPGGEPTLQPGQRLIWKDAFDDGLSDAQVLANYITLQPQFIHAEAGAGLSGSGALRFDWLARTTCQDDSHLIEQGITPTREIYVSYSIRYTPNFQFDWRNHPGCTGNAKKLFFLYSVSGSRFDFITENHWLGMGSDYDHPLFAQNQGGAVSDETWGDGNWHRITIHVLQSSTPTATDGIIEGWIDGVQRWSYRNVASNASGGWNYFHFPSTFNQGSPVNQSEWIDNLAVWKP